MSSCATLLEMLSAERLYRCEKYRDVPDRDGSKPFVFSIDNKDLQASNRYGLNWNRIFDRARYHCFKGDLTQQFAAFKKWLESDKRKYRRKQSKRSYKKKLRFMSNYATLLQMLAVERVNRCENTTDVPDHDGNKPFDFSIDGKDLQASNRKGAHWNEILNRTKTYVCKGDLTQQFAAFKKWLESDRRKRTTVCSNRSQDQPPVKKLRFMSSCATLPSNWQMILCLACIRLQTKTLHLVSQ